MKVHEVLRKLRENVQYKQWQAKSKAAKLVHIFLILDPTQETKYDIGFYDFKKEVMTSFAVDEAVKNLEINYSNEVFKQENEKINPLDEKRVKVCFTEACKIARELQQSKYKMHVPLKEVVILQNLNVGQVWNITYITKTMQTLNMKIDAEDGKVVEDKLHAIFSFDK